MTVHDLWYSRRRDPNTGKRLPTKRHGRGKRYRVTTPGLPSEHFDNRGEAERFDAARRTDHARGVYIDPALGETTVQAFSEVFRAAQLHRTSTAEIVERLFRLHINPQLGKLPLSQVRATTIQRWVKGLDLSPATVRVAYAMLNSMFTAATRDRRGVAVRRDRATGTAPRRAPDPHARAGPRARSSCPQALSGSHLHRRWLRLEAR